MDFKKDYAEFCGSLGHTKDALREILNGDSLGAVGFLLIAYETGDQNVKMGAETDVLLSRNSYSIEPAASLYNSYLLLQGTLEDYEDCFASPKGEGHKQFSHNLKQQLKRIQSDYEKAKAAFVNYK